jgi:hypothetical protein
MMLIEEYNSYNKSKLSENIKIRDEKMKLTLIVGHVGVHLNFIEFIFN